MKLPWQDSCWVLPLTRTADLLGQVHDCDMVAQGSHDMLMHSFVCKRFLNRHCLTISISCEEEFLSKPLPAK